MIPDDGSNLPIPHRERNIGGDLQVCHTELNGPHPWRKLRADDDSEAIKLEAWQQAPPIAERRFLKLRLSTFILSCVLLLLVVALAAVGIIFGNKIRSLEAAIAYDPGRITMQPGNASSNSSSSTISNNTNSSNDSNASVNLPATNTNAAPDPNATPPLPPTILVPGWTYLGCYYDSEIRVLSGARRSAGNMTNEACGAFCLDRTAPRTDLQHFGTQIGVECFCGNAPDEVLRSKRAPDWMCSRQCSGRWGQTENCGGNWVLSLWERDEGEG